MSKHAKSANTSTTESEHSLLGIEDIIKKAVKAAVDSVMKELRKNIEKSIKTSIEATMSEYKKAIKERFDSVEATLVLLESRTSDLETLRFVHLEFGSSNMDVECSRRLPRANHQDHSGLM